MMLPDVACFAMINRFDNNWIDIVINLVLMEKKLHLEERRINGRLLPC
jgi:hypothetical protein